jgi:hypothetical protein
MVVGIAVGHTGSTSQVARVILLLFLTFVAAVLVARRAIEEGRRLPRIELDRGYRSLSDAGGGGDPAADNQLGDNCDEVPVGKAGHYRCLPVNPP